MSVGDVLGDIDGLFVGELDGELLGLFEGATDGLSDGDDVGIFNGDELGFEVGSLLGNEVGELEGDNVGFEDGGNDGKLVGSCVGDNVGDSDGELVGDAVGICVGSVWIKSEQTFLDYQGYLLYFELEGPWDEVSDLKWVYLKELNSEKRLEFASVFEMEIRKVWSLDSVLDLCAKKNYLRRLPDTGG